MRKSTKGINIKLKITFARIEKLRDTQRKIFSPVDAKFHSSQVQ